MFLAFALMVYSTQVLMITAFASIKYRNDLGSKNELIRFGVLWPLLMIIHAFQSVTKWL